jgi:DNA-binding MarR family transcriptional regulator
MPRPQPSKIPPLALETFLPYQLALAAGAVSDALAEVYRARFGLSIAEWRVIANLGRFGPLNAGDLAAHSTLDKPKVTRAVQRLKARRLLTRTLIKADRRQVCIALTTQGLTLFAAIATRARAWEHDLAAVLSPSERQVLDRALAKLTLRARDLQHSGGTPVALGGKATRRQDGARGRLRSA